MQILSPYFKRPTRCSWQDLRQVFPFFILLTFAILFMYGSAVTSNPLLKEVGPFVLFTGLMLLHLAGHWIAPALNLSPGWACVYLVLQGIIISALIALTANLSLVFGLYLGLIGEAAGLFRNKRLVVLAIAILLLLMITNISFGVNTAGLWPWLLGGIPLTAFVIIYVVLFVRQIEARARDQQLLAELEATHRQLSEYSARIEDLTLANERQRMARELHDTLAQGLAGLILQLEAASSHLENNRVERAQAIIQQTMSRARTTLAEARRVIDDLRQRAEHPADLGEAIQSEARHFSSASGIPCEVELADLPELSEGRREHVLRVVAEGLNNIAQHARASRAWLHLSQNDGWLELELGDDGLGFDLPQAQTPGHYGLLGMRERARLAGGSLQIDSAPTQGTVIHLRLPIEASDE